MLRCYEKTAFERDLHFLSPALIYRNKRPARSGTPEHTGGLLPSEASTGGRRGEGVERQRFHPASCHRFPATSCPLETGPAAPAAPGYGDKTRSQPKPRANRHRTSAPWRAPRQPCSNGGWGTGLAPDPSLLEHQGITALLPQQIRSGLLSKDNICLLLISKKKNQNHQGIANARVTSR